MKSNYLKVLLSILIVVSSNHVLSQEWADGVQIGPAIQQNPYYHPDDVKVPPGALNPAFAEEEPQDPSPEDPGVWPGRLYWPRGYNDTGNQGQWKIYIKSWDSDPPNVVWVYVHNDSPNLQKYIVADLHVSTGWNGASGYWPENRRIIQGIEFPQGMTKVNVNIHHVKGQIIHANLVNAKEKTNIKLFNLGVQAPE